MAHETVFVVGAGASMPYKMPSGPDLRGQIEGRKFLFSGGRGEIRSRVVDKVFDMDAHPADIRNFFLAFKEAPQDSIDRFLAANEIFSEIGKICIADCLLEAEQSCLVDDRKTKGHWLQLLFNQLNLSLHPERLENVAFITFNYDRLIERYFEQAFKYGCFGRERLEEKLKIVHVHGSLGAYPETRFPRVNDRGTGTTLLAFSEINSAAKNIEIIHESESHEESKTLLKNARKIVFMEFSFAEENLRKIWPNEKGSSLEAQIFGTAYGLLDGEVEQIPFLDDRSKLRKRSNGRSGPMGQANEDCETILRKYDLLPRFQQ